ncbi:jumonji domain-containing protein 6 [Schistosoma haematobium]|uniref:Jumonji domain-containing protein 6 n=1 Tax=Schistosoma haematobium TaxID=6185 RepID=A0A922LGP0_SCHHA|nr:jumonji domain-containing protein 6 [Schistosoma haematobium]KAH9583398.1 jumonji domain-containing protein 6 [Schistosoma haematobium]
MRNPLIQLPDRQANTFLNVGDLLFYCARAFSIKGSLDLVRRCFKIGKLPERIWFDVGPSVEQIIAYTNPLGILFGLGANGGGVMMSKDMGKTWISINPFMYQNTLNTSTEIITASVIPWISSTGSIDNTLSESFCKMRVANQWNGVYDTTLPMMNRSVRLTVFIQIYKPSLVSVKFEAKISPLGKNSTVNFCESQPIAFAGPNLVANNVLTLKDTSVVNQAEKLHFFNLQLSILPSTRALYSICINATGKIKAEPCSVDYLLTENNSTKKSSSQAPGVDLISIDSKTVKNQVIPNYLTSLKLTLTLKPNVWQSIYFQLYAPGAYQEYILVKPIMLSQSTSLPYVSSVSDSLENMVYISIDKAYYEGIATDQTTSAANQLTYYIPMFTANSVRPLVNFTYNLTVNSISTFGSFIFTTTTPAAFTTTFTNTWTLISPSATNVYKQMCTGGPFEFNFNMCLAERRCSFFTYWINRIVNGIAALNVTKIDVYKSGSDVWFSTSFSINLTSERRINLGSNLFYTTTAYSSNYLSTYPTDQNDQLLIYFENITNIGTVSVPIMRNTLSLSVDIQLSDSKIVENGTVWPLQITGRFNAVTNISKISVSCVRTGSEKPSIHVVLSQLSSFTFSDYPDRDVVYLQTTVQMMNGTGLGCERQSIIFYLSPEIKSIIVVNQTGNIDNVTLKTPLNPVTKSVQFIAGRLYFGAKYEVIFSLKFNPSLSTTIVKYPILVEIVCKPYERGSPVVNSCAKQKFYKFKSHLRVQLDYTYPYNLPHYVAMRNPLVQLPDRQANTFLNVGDLLFYCARAFNIKGSLDLVRRCFKISKLPERIWFDVGPSVEQIIAYTNPLGILFGLGANGGGVMMSKDMGKTWISINPFMYQNTLNTSTEIITASVIPWISSTGSIDNTLFESFCKMRVANQWNGVYDTTLPMMNRSVRLTVFIQIYKPNSVSFMFEAKISPLGKNSTVNFCESQPIAFTGSNLAWKSNLTLKDTSVVNQAEKLQFFNVELSVPPYTTATYTILITNTGKLMTEPCSVDYLLTENNSTKNIRLITEYTVFQGRRTTGTTTIGIFRNNGPWNIIHNFRIGLKLLYDASYTLGDTMQVRLQMFSIVLTLSSFVVTLPITSMELPITTTPVSKTPVVTIEKVEPRNSQPTVNFSTIVEVRVKFIEDFVYMPITFQLQVNSNEAIIIRQCIQTIGYLLKAVALVGYDFSVKP